MVYGFLELFFYFIILNVKFWELFFLISSFMCFCCVINKLRDMGILIRIIKYYRVILLFLNKCKEE